MKANRPRGAVRQVARHPPRTDGIRDYHGHEWCLECGLRDDHPVHEPRPVDPAAADVQQRIVGERDE